MSRTGYKLKTPTLGILCKDGQRLLVTIPASSVVYVVEWHDLSRFVDVEWEGQLIVMFLVDLHERAELFRETGAAA